MTDLLANVLAAFVSPEVHVEDLPSDSPQAVNARKCEKLFTGGVDTLRNFPQPDIRMMGRLIWDLIASKQAATAVYPDIPSITFAVVIERGIERGMVLMPERWPQMVEEDAVTQLGAIFNAGIQVVDFCNGRLLKERPAALARCLAYEAELLRMVQTMQPSWKPNDYQTMLLTKYPEGIRSAGVDLYEPRSTAPKGSA
jgi:hypothetical protein